MKIRVFLMIGLALASTAALAGRPTWRYGKASSGSGIELVQSEDGTVKGHAFVQHGACTGEFFGSGAAVHGLVRLRPEGAGSEDACVLAVVFNAREATVVENGCGAWHGASCGFSGIYPAGATQ